MAIEIEQVVESFNLKLKRQGRESSYECPLNSRHTFDINSDKNCFKCWHMCQGCTFQAGGPFELYLMIKQLDKPADTAEKNALYKAFCFEVDNGEAVNSSEIRKIKEERAKEADGQKADDAVLDAAYRSFFAKCKLSEPHRKDLHKRGLTDDQIEELGFKSIPQIGIVKICREINSEGIALNGVPGFYQGLNSEWRIATGGSGYYIPYKNLDGKVVGAQIRYDIDTEGLEGKDLKEAKQRRYRWFSSCGMKSGTSSETIPYYGEPREGVDTVYITEGGLKAACAEKLANRWFVSIPGVSCLSAYRKLLSDLKELGVKRLVDAFDTDRKTNESVANSIKKLYEIAESMGFEVIEWPAFMSGDQKGCDDYLLERSRKKKKNK